MLEYILAKKMEVVSIVTKTEVDVTDSVSDESKFLTFKVASNK